MDGANGRRMRKRRYGRNEEEHEELLNSSVLVLLPQSSTTRPQLVSNVFSVKVCRQSRARSIVLVNCKRDCPPPPVFLTVLNCA